MKLNKIALLCLTPLLANANTLQDVFYNQASLSADLNNRLMTNHFMMDNNFNPWEDYHQWQWLQGVDLSYKSGFLKYQDFSFAVDVAARAGALLKDKTTDGDFSGIMLPYDDKKTFGRISQSMRIKYSTMNLQIGEFTINNPIVSTDHGDVTKGSVTGGVFSMDYTPSLMFEFGYINKYSKFYSSSSNTKYINDDLTVEGVRALKSISFTGFNYKFNDQHSISSYYGDTEDLYSKFYFSTTNNFALNDYSNWGINAAIYYGKFKDSLAAEQAFFYANGTNDKNSAFDDNGVFKSGHNNKVRSIEVYYQVMPHKWTLSNQKVTGKAGFSFDNGDDAFFMPHRLLLSDYNRRDEVSWLARYDFTGSKSSSSKLKKWNFALGFVQGTNIYLTRQNLTVTDSYNYKVRGAEKETFAAVDYNLDFKNIKGLKLSFEASRYRPDFNLKNYSDYEFLRKENQYRLSAHYPISIF